ncbi:hypothetical protein [Prochlorococcus sp. MIT 1303]|uniref:hypothetical protein n=1 Tax=Prochlorococcus sp. MIT 1303 TaxID=1723647 RepID=UPI0012E8AAB0|nr:hypothetical protein [Prochlorococcus sp. MIT 1303]
MRGCLLQRRHASKLGGLDMAGVDVGNADVTTRENCFQSGHQARLSLGKKP